MPAGEEERTHKTSYVSDSDSESDDTSESKSSTSSDEEEEDDENAAMNISSSSSNSSSSESPLSRCVVCNASLDGRNGNELVINTNGRGAVFQRLFAGYTGAHGPVCNVCCFAYKNHVTKERQKAPEKEQQKETSKEQKKAPEKEQEKTTSKEQQKTSTTTAASSAQSSNSAQTDTTNANVEICVCCDSKLTNPRKYNYYSFKDDYMVLFPGSDKKIGTTVCENCYRKGRKKRKKEAESAKKNPAASSNGSVAKSGNAHVAKPTKAQATKSTNKPASNSMSSSNKKDKAEKTGEQIATNSKTKASKSSVIKEKSNSNSPSETTDRAQTKKTATKRAREGKIPPSIDDYYPKRSKSNESENSSVSLDHLLHLVQPSTTVLNVMETPNSSSTMLNAMDASKPPTATSPIIVTIDQTPEVTVPTNPTHSPLGTEEVSANQLPDINNPPVSRTVSQIETTIPSNELASIADELLNKRLVDIFVEFRFLKVYDELFIRPESVFPKEYYETVYITRVTISIPITLTQLKEIANQKADQFLVSDRGETSSSIQGKYEVLSLRRVQKDYIGEEILENITSDDTFTHYPIFAKERFVAYLRKKLVNK